MAELDTTDGAAIVPDQEEKKGKVKPRGDLPKPKKKPSSVNPPTKPPTRVMR